MLSMPMRIAKVILVLFVLTSCLVGSVQPGLQAHKSLDLTLHDEAGNNLALAAPGPVLTIDAGNGLRAEISDYYLIGGQLCFTVKNLSPIPIIAIGFADKTTPAEPSIISSSFSQAGSGSFTLFNPAYLVDEHNNPGALLQSALVASSHTRINNTGIAPGLATAFCLTGNFDSVGLSERDLISKLMVLFNDGSTGQGCYTGVPRTVTQGLIRITSLTDNQICLFVANDAKPNPQGSITAFGFDLPGQAGAFMLSSFTPNPQPASQNFTFSTAPHIVSGLKRNEVAVRRLDFAFLTGETFMGGGSPMGGIAPGESSATFCVAGNFVGLNPEDILASAFLRFHTTVGELGGCPGPGGNGLTGVIGGNPR